ncbi:unnamed protein product [Schistosoma margrebowiei]|uniref:Protein MEMO1 n=1 Tax=Schistosoma margrebowiei TaxID=48269 RepID=A0A3P8CD80_9TREM|nr:unnamed protein product [Schistosoma margrebowiei]
MSSQLNTWLESCEKNVSNANSVRAIIVPECVFIIGPSHRLDIGNTCALTSVSEYETPFYNLKINTNGILNPQILRKDQYSIVPIVVGCLSFEKQEFFGNLLSSYMLDEKNLFVISSDFCHWGKRFRYQYYNKSDGAIWQSIEKLDHLGLNAIRSLKPKSFIKYLEEYRNTICGRRSIGVLLFMIDCIQQKQPFNLELKILNYTQSNRCQSMEDSSVSYTACALVSRE